LPRTGCQGLESVPYARRTRRRTDRQAKRQLSNGWLYTGNTPGDFADKSCGSARSKVGLGQQRRAPPGGPPFEARGPSSLGPPLFFDDFDFQRPMNYHRPHGREKTTPRFEQWRFGDEWPGLRCGARARSGEPCRKPALRGKRRCQLHGGRSTGGPTGTNNGNYRHGRATKIAKDRAKRSRARLLLLRMIYPLARKCDAGRANDAEKETLKQLELIYDRTN
jgi:hypothetical protein